jgi:hypothetical protein
MGTLRATTVSAPPRPVLGFGDNSERAAASGIAAVADLLR